MELHDQNPQILSWIVAKLKGTQTCTTSSFQKISIFPSFRYVNQRCHFPLMSHFNTFWVSYYKPWFYNSGFKNAQLKTQISSDNDLLLKDVWRTIFYKLYPMKLDVFVKRIGRWEIFLFKMGFLRGFISISHVHCESASQRTRVLKKTHLLGEIISLVWHCHCLNIFSRPLLELISTDHLWNIGKPALQNYS